MNLIRKVEDPIVDVFLSDARAVPGFERLTIEIGGWDHGTSLADPVRVEKMVADFIQKSGFHNERGKWRVVEQLLARRIATFVATRNLGTGAPVTPPDEGEKIVKRFFEFFPRPQHCLTNGKFDQEGNPLVPITRLSAWNPITDATVDSGVILIGANRIGLLWALDES